MASELPPLVLPPGVESHYISSPQNDLRYHFLSHGKRGDPLVLLYHGFPETSYCWRHVLPLLEGYYAVAPDTRGSGRSTTDKSFAYTDEGTELQQQQLTAMVRDAVIFVQALGYSKIHCLVGHDAGAVLAPMLALARPDLVDRLVVASHPYTGPPRVAFDVPADAKDQPPQQPPPPKDDIEKQLAALPEPRKHYKWYYASRVSAEELHKPEAGLEEFLRDYYYLKSASWAGNKPHALEAWDAASLAKMPYYYVMPLEAGMREACRRQLEVSGDKADTSPWLRDDELRCFAADWARTGFQGAVNWYRISTQPYWQRDLMMLAGAKLAMPTVMMLGRQDWGSYQEPGVLQAMGDYCLRYLGERWIEDAGHWMQQEKVEDVTKVILEMCEYKL